MRKLLAFYDLATMFLRGICPGEDYLQPSYSRTLARLWDGPDKAGVQPITALSWLLLPQQESCHSRRQQVLSFLHVGVSSVLRLPDVGRCVLLVGGAVTVVPRSPPPGHAAPAT